ncbi:hypothetical protein DET54_102734 [Paenibacillus pabuli]|uniref:Uncharacterized protein n=1 Tax=Paenibacillus pabuli TaxID=1472 RepID=A0ABX9BR43_9BACL|nr:hypothetical protein DET54_102734 [Paenibacillus pabuli]
MFHTTMLLFIQESLFHLPYHGLVRGSLSKIMFRENGRIMIVTRQPVSSNTFPVFVGCYALCLQEKRYKIRCTFIAYVLCDIVNLE